MLNIKDKIHVIEKYISRMYSLDMWYFNNIYV